MRALVFGRGPDPWDPPAEAGRLVRNLSVTPVGLRDLPDATPLRDDWVVVRPLLTGICGSDAKQVLLDFEGDSEKATTASAGASRPVT